MLIINIIIIDETLLDAFIHNCISRNAFTSTLLD